MISIFSKVKRFLDSNDIDGARDELAQISLSLEKIDATALNFASLFGVGSQKTLEIALGVLGRKLLNHDTEIKADVVWLFLAAILSRTDIAQDSPVRISIIGLIVCVKNWESPIFSLLVPALDTFFKVSISEGNALIAEQTIDFLATWGESYAKAPHSRIQLRAIKCCVQAVLDNIDDLELKQEWAEGIDVFFEKADSLKYSDENIWSAGSNLLKEIYSPHVLRHDTQENFYSRLKANIFKLITSSLAAIRTISDGISSGLSIAVRIDNFRGKELWSVGASVIDKLERLLQEIADEVFKSITTLPAFAPPQSIPGSWTIILPMNLNSNQSTLLAEGIASLSLIENENNSSIIDSWRYCVAKFKEEDLHVNIAVSANTPELSFVHALSTDDIPDIDESIQPNIRILSNDVPQAHKLERVIDLASLLLQYPSSLSIIKTKFSEIDGTTDRDFSYYRRALQILGLADQRVQPTTACRMLNRSLHIDAKIRFLAYQFISSNVGSAWFNWQNASDLSEIQGERALEFLMEVCPSLSETTVGRRSRALQAWVNQFKEHY